jgi:hypothetical protein
VHAAITIRVDMHPLRLASLMWPLPCLLQGEMSATVMRYPREWGALVEPLRKRVGPLAAVKFGIGLNWNRLGAHRPLQPLPLPIYRIGIVTASRGRPLLEPSRLMGLYSEAHVQHPASPL